MRPDWGQLRRGTSPGGPPESRIRTDRRSSQESRATVVGRPWRSSRLTVLSTASHKLRALSEASVILRRHDEGSIQLLVASVGVADPSQANVILSEASLRAKSKDPHLVASSAWVADPSQAQDDSQPVEDPGLAGRCTQF